MRAPRAGPGTAKSAPGFVGPAASGPVLLKGLVERPSQPGERIVAVVVAFNRKAWLADLLTSLQGQTYPVADTLVVDNASTDGTADLVRADFPTAGLIQLPVNTGGAGGFHVGVREALKTDAAWLWLMDDDVLPRPDTLERLLAAAHAAHRRIAVPVRLYPDGSQAINQYAFDTRAQRKRRPPYPIAPDSRWTVDGFTFEGPLLHRSVPERVGAPEAEPFIRGDDMLYAATLFRDLGAGRAVLVGDAVMDRRAGAEPGVRLPSRVVARQSGEASFVLTPDGDFWKRCYYFRNLHLVWRRLGWRRRALKFAATHAGYLVVDAVQARRRGWAWRTRLRWNARAWWLGVRGRNGVFLRPGAYQAEVAQELGEAGPPGPTPPARSASGT